MANYIFCSSAFPAKIAADEKKNVGLFWHSFFELEFYSYICWLNDVRFHLNPPEKCCFLIDKSKRKTFSFEKKRSGTS